MTIFGLTLDQWLHFKLYLGLAAPLLLFLYLPPVLLGLLGLATRKWHWRVKAPVLIAYLMLAYAVPLGDVTLHSMAMAKVCGKAGLHVYRTVKAEGVSMDWAGPDFLVRHPYRFVESFPTSDGGVYHWERHGGEIVRSFLRSSESDWMYVSGIETPDLALGVSATRYFIINAHTKAVIAEDLGFSPWRGWIDRAIGGVIENNPHGCWVGDDSMRMYAVLPTILVPKMP